MNIKTEKVRQEVVRQTIDADGEMTEEIRMMVKRVEKEPSFIKVYLNDILYLEGISGGLNGILYGIMKRVGYNNELVLNSEIKRRIAEETKKSFNTVNGAITKFVKGKILIRTGIGVYTLNPYLFGKGSWEEIRKVRLTITYDLEGKTFVSEITKEEDSDEQEI